MEIHMNTQISLKLTAVAVAVMMNSVLLVGVAYLFNGRIDQHTSVTSVSPASPDGAGRMTQVASKAMVLI